MSTTFALRERRGLWDTSSPSSQGRSSARRGAGVSSGLCWDYDRLARSIEEAV